MLLNHGLLCFLLQSEKSIKPIIGYISNVIFVDYRLYKQCNI